MNDSQPENNQPDNSELDTGELEARLEFAVTTARLAGDITLEFFRSPGLAVERKSDASPVTEADRQAESCVCRRIADAYPDDGWIGEEYGTREGSSGYRWIIDPIDGTKSFICGVPLYSTLIGLEFGGRSVLGVIHLPALGETVFARQGGGAWQQRIGSEIRPARVSATEKLEQGIFVTSQVDSFTERGAARVFDRLQTTAWITRTWGDAYGYYLVATGRATLMVDPVMSVWDAAAILPVLQEAGGRFTDWNGEATVRGGEGVGSNGWVHREVLEIMSEADGGQV